MDISGLKTRFEQIGARVKLTETPRRRRWRSATNATRLTLDIQTDRRGEYFSLIPPRSSDPQVNVIDAKPRDRHLLLLVRDQDEKSKFLCGHDERHWFVAAIPESAPVGNVRQAMDALQPFSVRREVARHGLRAKKRHRRKNAAFRRQGEWFFVPAENVNLDESLVLTNEPLSRGIGSKPHMAEFCYRTGGQRVYVHHERFPRGIPERRYRSLVAKDQKVARWTWHVMHRNPAVYVRGRIRHADHATIRLPDWHTVVMNTENNARAMSNVAFLD